MGYDSSKIDAIEAIQIPVRTNKKKAMGLGAQELLEKPLNKKREDLFHYIF